MPVQHEACRFIATQQAIDECVDATKRLVDTFAAQVERDRLSSLGRRGRFRLGCEFCLRLGASLGFWSAAARKRQVYNWYE